MIKGILIGLAVVCCIACALFVYGAISVQGPRFSRQVGDLRQVGLALSAYAERHNDQLPPRLSDLVPEFFPSTDHPSLTYHDPDSGRRYDWLYWPRPPRTLSDLPSGTILAAAPRPSAAMGGPGKRLVLYRAGHPRWTLESDFQRMFREQLLPTPQ